MRLPHVRFTVREVMVVVAVVAFLLPLPHEAALGMAAAILYIWIPAVLIEMMIFEFAGGMRAIKAALALSSGALLLVLPYGSSPDPFAVVVLAITSLNLIGPLYVALRLRRGMRVVTGEALWAWQGLAWSVLLVEASRPHAVSSTVLLCMTAEFCRMSLIVALVLALYGPRPAPKQPEWGQLFGWGLMECNVLVWGWYASCF
jgi:hypothetical protein